MKHLIWDAKLIAKYNLSGPRYTSYPTALEFNDKFTENDFIKAQEKYPEREVSVYIHIPFCHKICYFCACNKIVTRQQHKADTYLDYLEKEIIYRGKQLQNRKVSQLHFGGGTPTFLTEEQMTRLCTIIQNNFTFIEDYEFGIEIDPREITLDYINHLVDLGCNRMSIGIQDFDPEVQKAINRVQDQKFIEQLVQRARSLGIKSINLDLIYGLPKQQPDIFMKTLEKVIAISPDRLSVFNYAHIPSMFPGQAKIVPTDLPSPEQKLQIFNQSIIKLMDTGYEFIGMDHFAKPENELAQAQAKGILHRNFQGYTTHGEADLIGIGVSSISMLGDCYAQNEKNLQKYYQSIDEKGNAIIKGFALTEDDCIRRDVIKEIICNFKLEFSTIEQQYNINFKDYFKEDLKLVENMVPDGIVELNEQGLIITDRGKLLVRTVCMAFDIYSIFRKNAFSRII